MKIHASQAFWGVIYPLVVLLFVLVWLLLGLTAAFAKAPESQHCALIDASFSSGVHPTITGEWPILTELKLESTLNGIGNPAGVFIHSHAVGGSAPQDWRQQWEDVQRQAALPGSAPLSCVILGISGAVVGDLYGTMQNILTLAQDIKKTGVRLIMLGFVPVDRLGKAWLDQVGAPGLANQGYSLSDYEQARLWYADQARAVADAYVNPWRLLIPIADGLHPDWRSSYQAAITVIDAVVYQRVYLP